MQEHGPVQHQRAELLSGRGEPLGLNRLTGRFYPEAEHGDADRKYVSTTEAYRIMLNHAEPW
jgi:hypothetical protein